MPHAVRRYRRSPILEKALKKASMTALSQEKPSLFTDERLLCLHYISEFIHYSTTATLINLERRTNSSSKKRKLFKILMIESIRRDVDSTRTLDRGPCFQMTVPLMSAQISNFKNFSAFTPHFQSENDQKSGRVNDSWSMESYWSFRQRFFKGLRSVNFLRSPGVFHHFAAQRNFHGDCSKRDHLISQHVIEKTWRHTELFSHLRTRKVCKRTRAVYLYHSFPHWT